MENTRRTNGGMGGGGRRMGGGFPFPGGGDGPYGGQGRGNGGGQSGENEERTQDLIRPANSLTIALKDAEVDLMNDQSHKLVVYTNGRKLQKSKDDAVQEITAHWNGSQLVSDEKTPRGAKMSRTLELAPDGRQFHETLHIDNNRSNSPLVLRYVYDASTQDQQ